MVGTEEESTSVAEDLRVALDNMINSLPIPDREQSRRETVKRLIEQMQRLSAQARSLLLLIANYLPQPNRLHSIINHENFGKEAETTSRLPLDLPTTTPWKKPLAKVPLEQTTWHKCCQVWGPLQ